MKRGVPKKEWLQVECQSPSGKRKANEEAWLALGYCSPKDMEPKKRTSAQCRQSEDKQGEKGIHPCGRTSQCRMLEPKRDEEGVPNERKPEWDVRA